MTLREFVDSLQEYVAENPETLDMQVIVDINMKDSKYKHIYFCEPVRGLFIIEDDIFILIEDFDDFGINEKPDAVCINYQH